MSKKDYIKLAEVLKNNKPTRGDISAWEKLITDMIRMLRQDNPLFNATKFAQACGYNEMAFSK